MEAISCQAPLLPTSFAMSRGLHFSMSGSDSASSSSSLSAPAPHYSPLLAADLPPPYATTCDSVLVADSPAGRRHHDKQQHHLAPAGGRAGKRRSRTSKRAPTTYVTTDPANFRIMVQQITGVQAEPGEVDMLLLQPALDAVLLATDTGAAAGASYGNPLMLPAVVLPVPGGDDEAAIHHQHQLQQQPCFPTLDSWNVMFETTANKLL